MFSLYMLSGAKISNITAEEIRNMFEIDRITNNKMKNITTNNVAINLTNIITNKTYSFTSLGSAVKYLKNASHCADQRILVKRINTNVPYYGYICHKA